MTSDALVHLVEPGGRGGVFQHAVEVARGASSSGFPAMVHTSADHEDVAASGVRLCPCGRSFSEVRSRQLRRVLAASWFVGRVLPHLAMRTRGQIVHVQGLFGKGLFALLFLVLGPGAERILFSPHNTFDRTGTRSARRGLLWAVRRADVLVTFSAVDAEILLRMGARQVITMPLVQYRPPIDPQLVRAWRSRFTAAHPRAPVVLLPGQIRPDKGIDDFLVAATQVDGVANFVVAGEDAGYASQAAQERDRLAADVCMYVDYFALSEFMALMAAADVVVAPYRQASSSGILSLASALGVASLAYPVGGLAETATRTTSEPTPASLAAGIDAVLSRAKCWAPRAHEAELPGGDWAPSLYGPPW